MRLGWVVAFAAGCGLSQPAPRLRAVSPAAVCGASAVTLTLDGEGFVALPTEVLRAQAIALPSVTLDGPMRIVLADSSEGGPVSYVSSLQLTVTVDVPPAGLYAIAVANPDGQASELGDALSATAVVPVKIESVDAGALCGAQADATITLRGSGFLAGSTVTVRDAASAPVLSASATVAGCALGRCTTLAFVVPQGALAKGTYSIEVTSPGGGGCEGSARAQLVISDGPSLTGATPSKICEGSGGTIMLTGTGFAQGATVALVDAPSQTSFAGMLNVVSATSATASFGAVPFAKNARVDVVVTNPGGCSATLPMAIMIKAMNGQAQCP